MGERWGTVRKVIATFRSSIFMTFDIFIVSRNISMDTKVNDFFCFLLKSELVWYLESSHLYHCRGWWPVSSLPAGVSLSLLSDQTPPQYLSRVMTQRSCRKYYLKLDSNTGDTPAPQFTTEFGNGKGDIKIQSLYPMIIIFSRHIKFHLHPTFILSSAA